MEQLIDTFLAAILSSQAGWAVTVVASLSFVGSAVTVGKAYIKKSVSQKDDAWLASVEAKPIPRLVLSLVEKFSLVRTKE